MHRAIHHQARRHGDGARRRGARGVTRHEPLADGRGDRAHCARADVTPFRYLSMHFVTVLPVSFTPCVPAPARFQLTDRFTRINPGHRGAHPAVEQDLLGGSSSPCGDTYRLVNPLACH
jgi:hypothetical protein